MNSGYLTEDQENFVRPDKYFSFYLELSKKNLVQSAQLIQMFISRTLY